MKKEEQEKQNKNPKKNTKKQTTKKVAEIKKEIKVEPRQKTKTEKVFQEKRYTLFDAILLIVLVCVASIILTSSYMNKKFKRDSLLCTPKLSRDKNLERFTTVYQEIIDNYFEKINKKEMINEAITGMTDYLEDKYSIHMGDEESEIFNDQLEGTYDGIGIVIQGTTIIDVYEKSPAEEAGIKKEDIILEMNDTEVTEENLSEIIDKIKEEKGENIKLKIKRNNKTYDYKVNTRTIEIPIVTADYIEMNKTKIGYIKISSFTNTSYKQFSDKLVDLEKKGIEKLIIDLRSNNGGYLDKATDITQLFLEKGKVIYTLESKSKKEAKKDKTKDKRTYPIVVLINGGTASASEILAAALKDNNNAVIVGTKSYGKGKVQNTKKLSDGTILKYTSAKWLRPNGKSIDEVGITPDYEVENENDEDKQYEKALNLLK